MRAQELLQVEEGDLNITRLKKIAELFVHDEHTAIFRVLETIVSDVLRNSLGHFTSGDQFSFRETNERTELIGNLLLAVEAVILRTLSSLGSIRVVLLRLNLSDKLRQGLDFGTERGEFGLDRFKRHLISLLEASSLSLIFVTIM